MKKYHKIWKQVFFVMFVSVVFLCVPKLANLENSCYAHKIIGEDVRFNEFSTKNLDLFLSNSHDLFNKVSGDMLSLSLDNENVEKPRLNLNLFAIKRNENNIKRFGEKILDCNVFEKVKIEQKDDISNIAAAIYLKDDTTNGSYMLICSKCLRVIKRIDDNIILLGSQFGTDNSEKELIEYAKNEPNKKLVVRIFEYSNMVNENYLGESDEFSFDELKKRKLLTSLKKFPDFDLTQISNWLNLFKTYFNNEDKLLTPVENSPKTFKQSWDVVNFAFNKTKNGEFTLNFNILPIKNTPESILNLNEKVENCKIFENIKPKANGKSNITMAIFASPTGLKRDEKLIFKNELDLIKISGNNNQPVLETTINHETLRNFAEFDPPKSLIIRFYNSENFDLNNPNQGLIGVFGDNFCTDEKVEVIPTSEPQNQQCKIRDSYRTNRDKLLTSWKFDQNYSCNFVFKRKQDGNLGLLLNLFVFDNNNPNFDRFINNNINLTMAIFNNDEKNLKLIYKNKLKSIFCDETNKIAIFGLEIAPSDLINLTVKPENGKKLNNQLVMKFYDGDFEFNQSDFNMQKQVSEDLEQNLIGSFAGGTHDRTFSIVI